MRRASTSPTTRVPMYEDTERVPLYDIEPGDLLFYGPGGDEHVAMYVGGGEMIEAPETGQVVHITPIRLYGGFVGLGRPGLGVGLSHFVPPRPTGLSYVRLWPRHRGVRRLPSTRVIVSRKGHCRRTLCALYLLDHRQWAHRSAGREHRHQLEVLRRSPRPMDRGLAGRPRQLRRHRPRSGRGHFFPAALVARNKTRRSSPTR